MKVNGFALLAFYMFAICSIWAGDDFNLLYKNGVKLLQNGEYIKAEAIFKDTLKIASGNDQKTNAIIQLSISMRGKEKEALALLQKYLNNNERLSSSQIARVDIRIGDIAYKLKNFTVAIPSLKLSIDSGKLSARDRLLAYRILFDICVKTKDTDGAKIILEKWDSTKDISANEYSQILMKKATLLIIAGQFEQAIAMSENAAKVKDVSAPYSAAAYQQMAYIALEKLKDPTAAKSYIEKCASIKGHGWGYSKVLHDKINKACENK